MAHLVRSLCIQTSITMLNLSFVGYFGIYHGRVYPSYAGSNFHVAFRSLNLVAFTCTSIQEINMFA